MFGRFFKRNKREKQTPQSKSNQRDLFEELFPLTKENQLKFETAFNSIFEKMYNEEGNKTLKEYSRNYSSNEMQFGSLRFDDMNWNQLSANENRLEYQSNDGDVMIVDKINPNGKMEKGESQIAVYRNWIRDNSVQQGGGLIMCEEIITKNAINAYESIIKVPRQETTGMDYVYFLNMSNFDEQKLYQIRIKIFEMNPTGMRDNISMHPICEVAKTDLSELMGLYRKDPYQKNFNAGNVMNISEREEFDNFFPFHPLSIIRKEISLSPLTPLPKAFRIRTRYTAGR